MTYDVLNRLKWDNGVSAGNPTYSYDANGNRLARAATVAGFNAQALGYTANSNRLSTFNGTSVSYDAQGNVTGGVSAATLSYGANTRLAQIAEYSNDLYLTYNGLGELARTLQTTEDGCGAVSEINREYYHFATDGRALELVQENGSRVQWDWLWLDNLPVLQFEDSYDGAGTLIGTTATYLHPDHLGTPRVGTDTAGAIQWRYRSDGFGTASISGTRNVRLRLPGQIALGLGAINYNYFRDYDPNTGRYLESDPIGLAGGLNTYGYVAGNPLTNADPLGLSAADVQRIIDTFNRTVTNMTSDGSRHPNPYLNNLLSSLNTVTAGVSGKPYLGCGDQEEVTRDQLEKRVYEDTWTFTRQESLFHRWGEARSSNPLDPVVVYDPWKGTIVTRP